MWEMLAKVRPNALIMGTLTGFMTFFFGLRLYNVIDGVIAGNNVDANTIALVLALAGLTFTPLGALISFATQLATDPPPPSPWPGVVERLIDKMNKA